MKRELDVDDPTRPTPGPGPERPGAQWVVAGVALVVGLLGGMALGALLARDGGPLGDDGGNGEVNVPTACRDAIAEARVELDAREAALSVPAELSDVIDRAGQAIAAIDTAALEQILRDLETLANEARDAATELESDEFEALAQACEAATAPAS